MGSEKRRSVRIAVDTDGSLSWQTERSETMSQRVKVINVSEYGARIEMGSRLELRQSVTIRVDAYRIDSSATVRYREQRGLKFIVGLELSSPASLKPRVQRWT